MRGAARPVDERLARTGAEAETVRFDIIFYVRMKDGLSQIIVNVEAQQKNPTEYHILNRAIFYVCRMVSSQKERDFVKTNYDDIKRVVSIWICLNMKENSMNHYHLTNDVLLGNQKWEGKEDMISIVLLGLSNELPEHDEEYELHRLLGALLSKSLTQNEKLNIIGNEYDIPLEDEFRKGLQRPVDVGFKPTGAEAEKGEVCATLVRVL
jgi:hypothetical protein